MFHKIKSVTPLPGYALLVHFADGCARQYNMAPLLDQIDAFAPLRTVPGLFEQVRTDPGGYGISWNDDIDLDGSELWENGQPVSSPFDGLLSFADATSLWGHGTGIRPPALCSALTRRPFRGRLFYASGSVNFSWVSARRNAGLSVTSFPVMLTARWS